MASGNLSRALLSGTRRRIILLLRSQKRTVRELADALDLTRNAVRAQLSKLKGDGLVEVTGRRPTRRKPEHVYGLTGEAEALFQKSYDTILNTVLSVLGDTDAVDPGAVLQEVGRRLGRSHKPAELESSTTDRVERARQMLEDLGGLPELVRENGTHRLEGRRCPIASAVKVHGAEACELARALIEELTEQPVERQCAIEEDEPQCKFVVTSE